MNSLHIELRKPFPHEEAYLHSLYSESFPVEEQRPWSNVWEPTKQGCPAMFAIEWNSKVIGLLSWWHLPSAIYIEHFAISPLVRGGGIGSVALRQFLTMFPTMPIVLEVEIPTEDNPMSIRRIEFYKRAGFHLLPDPYMQPPYSKGLPAVPLRLMSTLPTISAANVTHELHTLVYNTCQ